MRMRSFATLKSCPYRMTNLKHAKEVVSAHRPSRSRSTTLRIVFARLVNGLTTEASASLSATPAWAVRSAP
eukprot:4578374-Lingulodinium_polyedra.AAC.1